MFLYLFILKNGKAKRGRECENVQPKWMDGWKKNKGEKKKRTTGAISKNTIQSFLIQLPIH